MVRTYKKKTLAEYASHETMKQAVLAVVQKGYSYRQSADQYGVNKSTLSDYVKRHKISGGLDTYFPNFKKRQVFTSKMEATLAEYLLTCSKMFYGLAPRATRPLAYEFAIRNSVDVPESWENNHSAGEDWLSAFLKRNSNLSLRRPEATSLARMTSFNKTNVTQFQNNLCDLYERYHFKSSEIYNLDEVGYVLTVM